MRKALAILLLLGCTDRTSKLDAGPAAPKDDQSRLDALVRENLDAELQASPTLATWLGAPGHDDRLDDVRLDAQSREASRWKQLLERARAIPEDKLDAPRRIDRGLLIRRAEAALQELTDLRPLERNPGAYIDLGQSAIFELVANPTLPAVERLRLVTTRLWKMRPLFDEARRNLRGTTTPDLAVKRAIDQGQAFKSFLQDTLPRVVQIEGNKFTDDFRNANGDAGRALDDFLGWLQKDLQPRAKGDFALGRERLMERLRVTEGLELTPELLLSVGEAELKEARRRLDEAERAALAGKPGDVTKLIEDDHAKPDELLREAQATAGRIMDLVSRDKLVPGGSLQRPTVTDMPPALWGYQQLNMAGPLERPREAYLYVEPVHKGWPERRKQEHLRAYNRPTMILALVHDLSRYLAAERNRRAPTTMQKLALAQTYTAGWPHYAERMLLDAGLAEGDLRLRVVAERAALTRAARLVAAIKLHAFGAKIDDAARIFTDSVGLDEYPARREAERAAADPMVMSDTLGRLEIERLRDDWRAAHADATLGAFHEALLAHGSPPIAVLRKILLPDDRRSPL